MNEIEDAISARVAEFWAAVAERPDDGRTYADEDQLRQIVREMRDAW